jgi:hypothetical protein
MAWQNISVYGIIDLISKLWHRYDLRRVANRLPIFSKVLFSADPLQLCGLGVAYHK